MSIWDFEVETKQSLGFCVQSQNKNDQKKDDFHTETTISIGKNMTPIWIQVLGNTVSMKWFEETYSRLCLLTQRASLTLTILISKHKGNLTNLSKHIKLRPLALKNP